MNENFLNEEIKITQSKLLKELKHLKVDIDREINRLENDDYMPNKTGIIQDSDIDKLCWQLHFLISLKEN